MNSRRGGVIGFFVFFYRPYYERVFRMGRGMTILTEEFSLRAWPAFETQVYDGWVLRFAGGYTKRSNSVNPLYPSSVPLPEKIAHCEHAYARRGLPCVFKLTPESTPAGLDRALEMRGYRRLDETSVQIFPLGKERVAEPNIYCSPGLCMDWLRGVARCSGAQDPKQIGYLRKILMRIEKDTVFAYAKHNGTIVACGLGVVDAKYIGLFEIVVAEAYRGQGYGRRIMEGLLAEGRKRGARTAYLQVVAGNTPAEKLYESLGFKEAYRYWYRKK